MFTGYRGDIEKVLEETKLIIQLRLVVLKYKNLIQICTIFAGL